MRLDTLINSCLVLIFLATVLVAGVAYYQTQKTTKELETVLIEHSPVLDLLMENKHLLVKANRLFAQHCRQDLTCIEDVIFALEKLEETGQQLNKSAAGQKLDTARLAKMINDCLLLHHSMTERTPTSLQERALVWKNIQVAILELRVALRALSYQAAARSIEPNLTSFSNLLTIIEADLSKFFTEEPITLMEVLTPIQQGLVNLQTIKESSLLSHKSITQMQQRNITLTAEMFNRYRAATSLYFDEEELGVSGASLKDILDEVSSTRTALNQHHEQFERAVSAHMVLIQQELITTSQLAQSILLVVSALALLLLVGSILFLKHSLTKRLNILRSGAEAIASGKFDLTLKVGPDNDPLEHLASSFNSMATQLKNRERENHEIHRQLAQAQKMEAVGMLAGGIAHNFNNNLAIILGNLELAELQSSPSSNLTDPLDNAKTAVLHSRELVQSLLTYSRKGTTNREVLKIDPLIRETVKLLYAILPVSVTIRYQPVSWDNRNIMVLANGSRLQEALINLCTNAVDSMDEHGAIDIFLQTVTLSPTDTSLIRADRQPGQYVRLTVQDNGCGISQEIIDQIFDPFFTTKALGEGTGMGLSSVQGIMHQNDGFIEVQSQLNEGTTFDLFFPIVETDKELFEETSLPQKFSAGGTEKILVVDDETMLAQLMEDMLSTAGYDITSQTSSEKALELFHENPDLYDLVITDQTMPELSGLDLVQAMHKIRPGLPTLLVTGYSSKISEKDFTEFGISAFCMKPLERSELLKTVRFVLDSSD